MRPQESSGSTSDEAGLRSYLVQPGRIEGSFTHSLCDDTHGRSSNRPAGVLGVDWSVSGDDAHGGSSDRPAGVLGVDWSVSGDDTHGGSSDVLTDVFEVDGSHCKSWAVFVKKAVW
ncbi:hypothetical protein BD324DRAFT_635456 [Kockovaella imperatae]|uniref:Uncharacterized protein n=1 Tax=Kockovaella imperatae TaxID=4999 RepID=A0A1Y1U9X1_9TREE|nr:hypothetical protein BD324DRAFT_635456 [Kockovaella imperatae]ORX34344.1 hypothetical protein BD324DRAFT_635456 [Kockovaella imperatae]